MHNMTPAAILVSVFGTVCFACFAWTTVWHFVWRAKGSAGAWIVSLLSWAGFLFFLWRSTSRPPNQLWPLTVAMFTVSLGFWAWTVIQTRVNRPTLAFTEDDPFFLLVDGPYAFVRHPFYTAYMIFWIGTALAVGNVVGWVTVGLLALFYWAAARHEEGKFARSNLAGPYRTYAMRTGRFIPRFLPLRSL